MSEVAEPAFGDPVVVAELLQRWAPAHGLGPVSAVRRMDGHSGWSYDFRSGDERLVLRLSPPGVRGLEGADALRQVPVLRVARAGGVPVPEVVAAQADDPVFGTGLTVVEFVDGRHVDDLFAPGSTGPGWDVAATFDDAVDVLTRIHALPWERDLAEWDGPRTVVDLLDRYAPAVQRAEDPDWVAGGGRLERRLRETVPSGSTVGVVHNDYYSNNWIVAGDGGLASVVDWETACVAPVLIDVGWLAMMYDPAAWSPSTRADTGWHPHGDDLAEAYCARTSAGIEQVTWFRAFSAFRLLSGISFYLRLHRRGRRVDDTWERFAHSVPTLLRHADDLLG